MDGDRIEPLGSGGIVPAPARPVLVGREGIECVVPLRQGVMPEWLGILIRNR